MPPLTPISNTSTVKDSQRAQLNQIVGKIADQTSSNSGDLVTALTAIKTAITAKPSA